jgi:hypothetical protein
MNRKRLVVVEQALYVSLLKDPNGKLVSPPDTRRRDAVASS